MKTADIADVLSTVIDPELGIDIVSLGMIYGLEVSEDRLKLEIALTTPNCPMGEVIAAMAASAVRSVGRERAVEVEVVDDPPWNVAMVSATGRAALGLPPN